MDSYEKICNVNYENASWIHKFIEYEGQIFMTIWINIKQYVMFDILMIIHICNLHFGKRSNESEQMLLT